MNSRNHGDRYPDPAGHETPRARTAPTPSLRQLSDWLDANPERRAWLHRTGDVETRAVCRAFAKVSDRGEVWESTVRLDLRVREVASRIAGTSVDLERVCAVRQAVQRADGLAFDAEGVRVVALPTMSSQQQQVSRTEGLDPSS